ncbi:MAG: histidine--tRNA ligase [Nitrospirae bacterium]|nr:histidine--tRNA ligase [Nitrospirota bacterium]
MEKIQAIKGVKDILPPEIRIWQHVQIRAREIFRSHGYEEILIPVFESTRLFSRSIGEVTDIVEKEMYTFEDRDGKSITLRPEGTASVVRAFIEHHMHMTAPWKKLFYIGPMFRRERPQAGRYRQFYQIGAEAFGVSGPGMDAEIIALIHALFRDLGIRETVLHVNSLGCPVCRPDYRAALQGFLKEKEESLCGDCRRRIDLNPLRVLDCKVPECREIVGNAPRSSDFLCEGCRTHLEGLRGNLHALEIPFIENPLLVRGLDYYTRTAFEFIGTGLGAQNTVAAGGRYDSLVADLGGPSTPAVGFSLGMERLISLLDPASVPQSPPPLFLAALGEEAREAAFTLLHKLRGVGIPAEMDYEGSGLKNQMRKADRLGASHVLIIGEEELTRKKAILRDMKTKGQEEMELADLPEILPRKLVIS